jgi:hypothetical protein
VFTIPPSEAPSLVAINPAIKVAMEDQFGNIRTSDSTTQIVMTIANNPSGGRLAGTTTQTASSGVATFSDLSIDQAGVAFALMATGGALNVTSDTFNIIPSTISITRMTPNFGAAAGGNKVTISGTGLKFIQKVTFGSAGDATITKASTAGTSITVTVPTISASADPGSVRVTIFDSSGATNDSSTASSLYFFGPQVTKVTPNFGLPAGGGKPLAITGKNFNNITAVKLVELNKTLSPGTDFTVSKTSIKITAVPAGTGSVHVQVIGDGGISDVTADSTLYSYGPLVSKVNPTFALPTAGVPITLSGHNFTHATSIRFIPTSGGGAPVVLNSSQFKIVKESSILITQAPDGTNIGVADVEVDSTTDGNSPHEVGDRFTFGPAIKSLSLKSGLRAGGYTMKITGSNFFGATDVIFGGGTSASNVGGGTGAGLTIDPKKGASITLTVPAHTVAGPVTVTVITPGGSSLANAKTSFIYI